MDESQSLVSFQIAGLLIQNSFRYLLNAMKSFNKRRLFKYNTIWKNKALKIPQGNRTKIKNSIVAVNVKLRNFECMVKCKAASILQDSLLRVLLVSSLRAQDAKISQEEFQIKSSHDLELQSLSRSIKSMQDSQEALEKSLKRAKSKEELSKTQTFELLQKKPKRSGVKDLELPTKIEELREENQEIREKIFLIEQNINQFLDEMGSFVDVSEESEKTMEKRKVSSKRVKIPKRPKVVLNTVDLSKLV